MKQTGKQLVRAGKRLGTCAVLSVLALSAACAKPRPANGNAKVLTFYSKSLLVEQVKRVTVTLTATDLTTTSFDLTDATTGWSGLLAGITPGSNRHFHAEAFDGLSPTAARLFQGDSRSVTIVTGQTAIVDIQLEQATPPPPFHGSEPVIDSLVASGNDVALGGSVTLNASAHDSDPALTSSLNYAWTKSAGNFTPDNQSSTVWTAPDTATVATLTLTVTDSNHQIASISMTITVEVTPGSGIVTVTFDEAPIITAMTPTPQILVPGQPTSIEVTATDAQGNGLTYLWSTTCADGLLSSTTTNPITVTLPANTNDTSCSILVTASNLIGASDTGTLVLSVQNPTTPQVLPQIDYQFQSTAAIVAATTLTLQVFAHSPQGHPLTFTWGDSNGSLGAQIDQPTTSSNTWIVTCAGHPDTATATITDTVNHTAAVASFGITEACSTGFFDTAHFDSNLFAD